MPTKTLEERFWSKVDRSGGPEACWMWRSGHDVYGTFYWPQEGRRSLSMGAHRASYLLTHGSIEPGMYVCHRCDTPLCVNPAHLFLGTVTDNSRDCWRKGRGVNPLIFENRAKTHCRHGHEYTPENTTLKRSGGWVERRCKTCDRAQRLARKAANPEKYRAQVIRMMQRKKERGETPEQRERRLAYFREYNAKRRGSGRVVGDGGVTVTDHESEGLSRAS